MGHKITCEGAHLADCIVLGIISIPLLAVALFMVGCGVIIWLKMKGRL